MGADPWSKGPKDPALCREIERLDRLATLMDSAIPVPGTDWRIGLDALIGLVPGAGDGLAGLVSLYLVGRAWRLGVPLRVILRMLANVFLELTLGSIPLVGDLFDASFKANRRNVDLLKAALRERL